jgi:citrate lyase subunit beta/citryl-CoA lyase
VLAAAAAGVSAPIDGVTTALHDEDALLEDVRRAQRLGFTGKLCIHPRQIDVVVSAFRPSDEQVGWARRVLAASGGSATQVDGKMVDRPVVARAQAILDRVPPK